MNESAPIIYGLIANDDHQFGTWPTHRKLPGGWRFVGPTGPSDEMQALLRMQFVETVAAPFITSDKAPRTVYAAE